MTERQHDGIEEDVMVRGGEGIKWDVRVFMWDHKLIGYIFLLTSVLYPAQH